MNLRQLVPALAIATLAVAPSFTAAAQPTPAPQRVVSFADLDLATAAGQRTLQQRIAAAARAVCIPLAGRTLRESAAWRECIARAVAAAQAQLPATALAAQAGGARAAR